MTPEQTSQAIDDAMWLLNDAESKLVNLREGLFEALRGISADDGDIIDAARRLRNREVLLADVLQDLTKDDVLPPYLKERALVALRSTGE
jgi:hypothetical protein